MAGWEIMCCGSDHEARLGHTWQGMLVLLSIEAWKQTDARTLGWRVLDDGSIDFVAEAIASPRMSPAAPILDLGACRIGAPQLTASGFLEGRGRVWAEWHEGFDPDREVDIVTEGMVRRVSLRREIREEGSGRVFELVGHEPAVDVASSLEARENPTGGTDVLFELDVAAT
jgi:hypothetical protein